MTGPREAPVPDVVDTMLDMLGIVADLQGRCRALSAGTHAGAAQLVMIAEAIQAAYRSLRAEFLALGMPIYGAGPGSDAGITLVITLLQEGRRDFARAALISLTAHRGAVLAAPEPLRARIGAEYAADLDGAARAVRCWRTTNHAGTGVLASAQVAVPAGAPAMLLRAGGATYAEACADLEAQLAHHRARPVLPTAIVAEPTGAPA